MSLANGIADMLSQLRDRLFSRLDETPGRYVLVLLDLNHPVALSHPLHIAQLEQRPIKPELHIVPRNDRTQDFDAHPRLLVLRRPHDLGYPDEALLALTLECALERRTSINGAYVCGWLVAQALPAQIAEMISTRILLNDLASYQRRVLPLFEPHRLVLASHLAPGPWLKKWFNAIDSWFLIDVSGRLRDMCPDADEQEPLLISPPGRDFWQAQSRVRRAREVLLAMVKSDQPIVFDSERKIDDALQEAERVGLVQTDDVIFFALNHMILPRQWHMHPAIRACIDSAVSGSAGLAERMSMLPDDILRDMSHSAWANAQMTKARI